jgi:hypothetical protein
VQARVCRPPGPQHHDPGESIEADGHDGFCSAHAG